MIHHKIVTALFAMILLALTACEKDPATPPAVINRIDYLAVDESQARLLLYGVFPEQQGSVTINQRTLQIGEWSPYFIWCHIPRDEANDYGDVVVHSGDSHSAKRRLHKWVILLEVNRPHGGIGGTLTETLSGQVAIRGDAKPAPANVYVDALGELYPGGSATYRTGGEIHSEYDCGQMKAVWDNTTFTVLRSMGMEDLAGQTHFQGFKKITPDGFDLYLEFEGWEMIPATVTTSPCSGPPSDYIYRQTSQLHWLDGYEPIRLRFAGNSHNLRQDSLTADVYSSAKLIWENGDSDLYRRTATLSWQSIVLPAE